MQATTVSVRRVCWRSAINPVRDLFEDQQLRQVIRVRPSVCWPRPTPPTTARCSVSIWSTAITVGPVSASSLDSSRTISCAVRGLRRIRHVARSPGSVSGSELK